MKRTYTMKEIQGCILSIIMDMDEFCRENEIEYYLMGGSALGAMRHEGFIPWDDDLDIFMTFDNYHKFLTKFERECLNADSKYHKYFVQKENTEEWPLFLSRVCLNGTTMISDEFRNNLKQHHTVFVDIMCLYSAPKNEVERWLQYMAAQFLRVNALARCGFKSGSFVKNVVLTCSKIVVNSITRPYFIKYVRRYEGKSTEYVGHYFGRARYKNASFLRDYLGSPRYVRFEDCRLPVFEKVELYLTARFGERWRELPSKEVKAQYPVHGNFVDLENDYTKYLTPDRKGWNYE